MVSMKDISARCGVSVATVSKALNGYKDIGEETRENIRQVAREMGYFPNSVAKALKTNRTNNIGVLFADAGFSGLKHDYFAYLLDSFKRTAEDKGYDITFINCSKNGTNSMTFLEHCRYRRFDGILIACTDFYQPGIEELVRSDIPLVTVDHIINNRSTVISNNIKGVRDLVTYIHSKGHTKIAYVHGEDSSVTQNRLLSFYKTCQDLGIEVPPEYVVKGEYRNTGMAYERTQELLELKDRPTCIMYSDDNACFGGMSAIRDAGLSIPDDISVAGYDGIRLARHFIPKLTTIQQNTEELGRVAAEKLIALIENPLTTLNEQIMIEGTLLGGESVAVLK